MLGLAPVRALVGEEATQVIFAAVALTLAVTPSLAQAGRTLAGSMRRRKQREDDPELQPRDLTAPVLIVGMGGIGRTLADALTEFEIRYAAIERDQRRLAEAIADGYSAAFGDSADPRIWEPMAMHGRQILVLTAPNYEASGALTPVVRERYPDLKRFVLVGDEADAERFRAIGMRPVVDGSVPAGLDLAAAVLGELGVEDGAVARWMERQQGRALQAAADQRGLAA